jgi:hypothetical protein
MGVWTVVPVTSQIADDMLLKPAPTTVTAVVAAPDVGERPILGVTVKVRALVAVLTVAVACTVKTYA